MKLILRKSVNKREEKETKMRYVRFAVKKNKR